MAKNSTEQLQKEIDNQKKTTTPTDLLDQYLTTFYINPKDQHFGHPHLARHLQPEHYYRLTMQILYLKYGRINADFIPEEISRYQEAVLCQSACTIRKYIAQTMEQAFDNRDLGKTFVNSDPIFQSFIEVYVERS